MVDQKSGQFWSSKRGLIILALLMVVAWIVYTGWEYEVDLDLIFKEDQTFQIYFNPEKKHDIELRNSYLIRVGDDEYNKLKLWFEANNQYWYQQDISQHNYESIYLLDTFGSHIHVYDHHIYIGYNNAKGYYREYTRSIGENDFDFLYELQND